MVGFDVSAPFWCTKRKYSIKGTHYPKGTLVCTGENPFLNELFRYYDTVSWLQYNL